MPLPAGLRVPLTLAEDVPEAEGVRRALCVAVALRVPEPAWLREPLAEPPCEPLRLGVRERDEPGDGLGVPACERLGVRAWLREDERE